MKSAISAAGHVVVDMAEFPAADQPTAAVCRAGAGVRPLCGGAPPDSISNRDPEASDKPSDNDPGQQQTERDVLRHSNSSDLR